MEGMGARTATSASPNLGSAVKKVTFTCPLPWAECVRGVGEAGRRCCGRVLAFSIQFFQSMCSHTWALELCCLLQQRSPALSDRKPGAPDADIEPVWARWAFDDRCFAPVLCSPASSTAFVFCALFHNFAASLRRYHPEAQSCAAVDLGVTPSVVGQRSCVQFGRKRCRDIRRGHWRDWQLRLSFLIQLPDNYGLLTAGPGSCRRLQYAAAIRLG